MRNEFEHGVKVVTVESVKGAAMFKDGKRRNGKWKESTKL
jgi:hypothetical protein